MELKLLIGVLVIFGSAVAVEDSKKTEVVYSGSGDAPVTSPAKQKTSTVAPDDEDDDDIYLDNSGDGSPDPTVEGSGVVLIATENMNCVEMHCWCEYDNGTSVDGTRVYGKLAENCFRYKNKVKAVRLPPTSTAAPTTPAKTTTEKAQPHVVTEVHETDFEVEVEEVTTKKTSTVKSTTTFSNDIKVDPGVKDKFDEEEEEETNNIGGANNLYLSAVKQEPSTGALSISHPGILAAIIGGGVVGLLCAILLVMFIVYRMRKKDEGSYPLNDAKPLKDYAYSKAPSKEFYA